MRNAAIVLNAVLLVAVGVLFYLHFSAPKKDTPKKEVQRVVAANDTSFRIAYFEWDSMTNHFDLFKQMQESLNEREEGITQLKMRARQQYQNKINSYKKEMSQAESEQATQELRQLENDLNSQIQKKEQDFQADQVQKNNDIKSKIEEYLKDYNKDKGFTYIMIYEPSLIFYRDTTYNITNDLIRGLNERYPRKK